MHHVMKYSKQDIESMYPFERDITFLLYKKQLEEDKKNGNKGEMVLG